MHMSCVSLYTSKVGDNVKLFPTLFKISDDWCV